jgi:hypothetical protein
MLKKAELLRMMASDKRRQAEAAWNPHVVRQCLELAKSYEQRAKLEEKKSAIQYADDADYGDAVPQWPRRAVSDQMGSRQMDRRPSRASVLAGPGMSAD